MQEEIKMPVLLAHAIEDSNRYLRNFGGGGVKPPNLPPPRYATE